MTNLTDLAKRVHEANIKWWQDPITQQPIRRNKQELLSLIVSELTEALEGERKNSMDDKLPHRKMAEVEMADAYIRALDFAEGFGYRLLGYEVLVIDENGMALNKGEAIFRMISLAVRSENEPAMLSHLLKQIETYCGKHGYNLWEAFEEKMVYNATREDHKHESRRIAGGKQF